MQATGPDHQRINHTRHRGNHIINNNNNDNHHSNNNNIRIDSDIGIGDISRGDGIRAG